jgi:CheY-like chemotaxis protein
MAPEPITVNGDLTRITQVVMNLLNNAAKYTPVGGEITVQVGGDRDDAIVRVRDNGTGIPTQLLERVFDMFAQGERTLARSEGGLGIGLTLARRIVALHGGTIKATSEGAGKGAEFTVRLPRLQLHGATQPAQGAEFALPRGAQKRSVLVVDDNVDSAQSMAMLLRMVGHDVEIAHDGPGALEQVARVNPDIILLDIGLPGMTGLEVAKHLRSRPEGQGLRIFAMTGYGQEADRQRSLEAGFDGHLVKPVQPGELFALIDADGRTH